MSDNRPAHLVATPGDRKTICGKRDQAGPALPCVWVRHAADHIDGHGMTVCAACVDALGMLATQQLKDAAA